MLDNVETESDDQMLEGDSNVPECPLNPLLNESEPEELVTMRFKGCNDALAYVDQVFNVRICCLPFRIFSTNIQAILPIRCFLGSWSKILQASLLGIFY